MGFLSIFSKGYAQCSCEDDFKESIEDVEQLVTRFGIIEAGMPKRYLKEAGFKNSNLVSYYRKGNDEWLTFSGRIVSQRESIVIFYIKRGKIQDWIEQPIYFKKNIGSSK